MSDASQSIDQFPTVDVKTNATNILDYAHHEIHGGNSFYVYAVDADLDLDGVILITMVTPDNPKWNHLLFVASASGAFGMRVYEDAVPNILGTPFIPINRDRNSSTASGNIVRIKDSFTSDGTIIMNFEYGAGKTGGTIFGQRDELILKQNTTYQFRATSRAIANKVSFFLDWYEHENK